MKKIGGYFGLELNEHKEFHEKAIKLNTGRNALEYILLAKQYKKIYLPFYICDSVLEPIYKHKIQFEFYQLEKNFTPVIDPQKVSENEVVLFINYFGLKTRYLYNIVPQFTNIIIDNTQAFFAKPLPHIDTFYSARKFFGVPDGAYLYTEKQSLKIKQNDHSVSKFKPLLMRWDFSPEKGYKYFQKNENALSGQPIKNISSLTDAMLHSINYSKIKKIREKNFMILHNELKQQNEFLFDVEDISGPMIYPYLTESDTLRERLIKNGIFVPQYWKEVLKRTTKNSNEYYLAKYLFALPIDQRYNSKDMTRIIDVIHGSRITKNIEKSKKN